MPAPNLVDATVADNGPIYAARGEVPGQEWLRLEHSPLFFMM